MRRHRRANTQGWAHSWVRRVTAARANTAVMYVALWSMWGFEVDLVTAADEEDRP